ncbi:calcium-dependent protein kinase 17-like [Spinacia oleracea]|uniref:Calcium-dependent protein kinase 17-like n=1 Tax=Spinacia oleracea TaxID=3562 RepID=A0A9R0JSP0_SPIOL|nr:calcium-dependent protein kinase 17-like [Spinacia oleracea]
MLHLHRVDKEDHLCAAFAYFDKDERGYITKDELQQACQNFGMDEVHVEEIIHEADQDKDGRIDYNEFVEMMQRGNIDLGKRQKPPVTAQPGVLDYIGKGWQLHLGS